MVEANSDPEVVTALIRRESREAAAARAAQAPAPQAAAVQYAHLPVRNQPAKETAMVVVDLPKSDTPVPASSGLWNRQIAFAMVLVAVLIAVWVVERRSMRRMKEDGHG